MPPVRLLTLTSLFPNSRQPRHGIFVANRLRRLCDTRRVEATVIAAIPRFPGAYREASQVPATEFVHGFAVAHPRYVHVPGIGMRIQPDLLAKALLEHLDNTGNADRYDVVDAHYFYPDGVAAARVAEKLRLPLVISARGSDINLIGDIAFARRRMVEAAERAQALIAVSEALATRMRCLGMPADRLHVLRNGVDATQFAPCERAEARQRLGLDIRGPLVLGVGNLVPEKGFDLLVRAVALLPDTRLLIVGEGRVARQLSTLAAAVAPGRVTIRGSMPQADLRFAYAAADVLGLPSLREGWPNVLLESLSCGTPVVASAVGGVPEIVGSAAAGTIVASRAPDAWAESIRTLLRSPPTQNTVSDYGMRFGWDEVVTRQCAVYEDVAGRWRPAMRMAGDSSAISHA